MTAAEQTAARLVYDHYKRRALRSGVNHIASFYHLWADKALDGAVNPLVMRVRRLVAARPVARTQVRQCPFNKDWRVLVLQAGRWADVMLSFDSERAANMWASCNPRVKVAA